MNSKYLNFSLFFLIFVFVACESFVGIGAYHLRVENVSMGEFDSSTKLKVMWVAPEGEAPEYYKIKYQDEFYGAEKFVEAESVPFLADNLKAGTKYEFEIIGCMDQACENSIKIGTVSGQTEEEYWQIQGEGNSYEEADKVVDLGSSLSEVVRLGEEEVKMYYNGAQKPGMDGQEDWVGMKIAGPDMEDYTHFSLLEGGIAHPCKIEEKSTCEEGALFIAATHAIPIKTKTKAFVRLFFEAADKEGITRNYYLDSQDGFEGEDFNPSKSSTVCGQKEGDFAEGGDCEPTLIFGEEEGLKNARQSKVALPVLDSPYWDMERGVFMVITGEDMCSQTRDGLFYAQWDGQDWTLEKDENDCAEPLVLSGHGPVLLHLGEDRYKLYYEEYSDEKNKKSVKMFYTDGMDFEDFEDSENAREVHFLWPNGDELSTMEESGLGDHFIFLPTVNLDEQFMYLNLGGHDDDTPKEGSKGIGLAVLLNP